MVLGDCAQASAQEMAGGGEEGGGWGERVRACSCKCPGGTKPHCVWTTQPGDLALPWGPRTTELQSWDCLASG